MKQKWLKVGDRVGLADGSTGPVCEIRDGQEVYKAIPHCMFAHQNYSPRLRIDGRWVDASFVRLINGELLR